MKRVSKLLAGSAALSVALMGTALAQPADGESGEVSSDPATDPSTDPNAGGAADPAVEGAATTGGYPQAIIDRPATLNAGMLRIGGELSLFKTFSLAAGETDSSLGVALGVSADYGISDKLEIGAGYALALEEFEEKGPLRIGAGYRVVDGQMKGAITADFTYNLASEIGSLGAGLAFQYNIGPKMALFTPGNQLNVQLFSDTPDGVESVNPIYLSLPVGFMYQVDPSLHLYASTSIGQIEISDSDTGFIFADFIPLTVGAFYTTPSLIDIGASLSSGDLEAADDNFVVALTARLHM